MEEISPEIAKIIKAAKAKGKKKLTIKQWEELRDFLSNVPNVKEYLTKEHGYSDSDYSTLTSFFSRHKWQLGAKVDVGRPSKKKPKKPKAPKVEPPEKIIEKTVVVKEREFATKTATEHMEDVYHLGNLVKSYGSRASEMGFHDKAADKPNLDQFITTALDFFIENRDIVQALKQDLLIAKATGKTVRVGFDGAMQRLKLVEMVLDLIMETTPELIIDLSPLRKVIGGQQIEQASEES
jgi:hypothetical protein